VAYESIGMVEEATECYERAVDLKDDDKVLWYNLGNVYLAMDKLHDAEEAFRRAVDLDKRFAEAWNNLGVTLRELGELVRSLKALNRALRLSPNSEKAWMDKASVLSKMDGKKREALKAYDKVLRIRRDNAAAWYEKGQLLEAMRMTRKARECYEEAAVLSPAYKEMLGLHGLDAETHRGIGASSFDDDVPSRDLDELPVKKPPAEIHVPKGKGVDGDAGPSVDIIGEEE
jgi:tetratricopeptide (TPR) repeat protein